MREENNKDASMSLMQKYFKVESLLRRYQHSVRKNCGRVTNPMRGQGRVLSLLKLQPTISQRELGYLLDMRNQSLGELLAKLERSGHITRTPSEQDRRVMVVTLTEEGKTAAAQMEAEQRDFDNPFDSLSEEDQMKLSEMLDRVIEALEDKLDEGDMYDEPLHGFDPNDPRMRHWMERHGMDARRMSKGGRGRSAAHWDGRFGFGFSGEFAPFDMPCEDHRHGRGPKAEEGTDEE